MGETKYIIRIYFMFLFHLYNVAPGKFQIICVALWYSFWTVLGWCQISLAQHCFVCELVLFRVECLLTLAMTHSRIGWIPKLQQLEMSVNFTKMAPVENEQCREVGAKMNTVKEAWIRAQNQISWVEISAPPLTSLNISYFSLLICKKD